MTGIRRAFSLQFWGEFILNPRNRRLHTFLISAGLLVHLTMHYATYIPTFRDLALMVPYIYPYFRLHVLHEAEFLILILYATLVWRLKGGLIAVGVTAVTSIPFILTPYIFGREPAPNEIRDLSIQVALILVMGAFKAFVLEGVAQHREARIARLAHAQEVSTQLEAENRRLHNVSTSLDAANRQLTALTQVLQAKLDQLRDEMQEVTADELGKIDQPQVAVPREKVSAFLKRLDGIIREEKQEETSLIPPGAGQALNGASGEHDA